MIAKFFTMEDFILSLHEEYEQHVNLRLPHTCFHFMAITFDKEKGEFHLHMVNEGAYISQPVSGQNPFLGHPVCPYCKDASLRFILGVEGNLVQLWSNAQYVVKDLHVVNQYSQGVFVVRSTTRISKNRNNLLAPKATATLVKNIGTRMSTIRKFDRW